MTEKNNELSVRDKLLRSLADPVLIYVVIAMTSIMNHYREELTLVYGIVTYVMGWLIFRLFDFINKHNLIGAFAYIALFMGFYEASVYAIGKGEKDYPISWGLWFLTPQSALQYNKWYTIAFFLLFLIFMLSVIYYFTRVRYRMFMNFLILIIPFSIYGKENETMKIGYIIALAVGYVVLMVMFRQLRDGETVRVVDKSEAWRSAAVFTVIFAVISSICPKPTVEADRTMIETLINADLLTDRFMEMLSNFRDDADGNQFRRMSNMILYYVESPQPMQLKTATFTSYDFKTDKWKAGDTDKQYKVKEDHPFDIYRSGEMVYAIREAAVLDSSFAAEYGISALKDMELRALEEKTAKVSTARRGGDSAPVPQGAKSFVKTSYRDKVGLSYSSAIYCDEGSFSNSEDFTYTFISPLDMVGMTNSPAIDLVASVEDQESMTKDAAAVLKKAAKRADNDEDKALYEHYMNFLTYGAAPDDEELLNYGGSEKIRRLAEEITAGKESDYDKARALEWYFIDNDYNYDLKYQKSRGENVEDFLFKTHTGVCYEYATAMTLMARSLGIPARYCEGFNMQQRAENWDGYLVTSNDAHGFPELYIKGIGWMGFEPTMTNNITEEEKTSVMGVLAGYGAAALGISLLVLITILLMPWLKHKTFLLLCRRRSPNKTARAVIHRICRIYGINGASTAHEAEITVKAASGADISRAADLFDKAEYGGTVLDETDKAELIGEYISAYEALRAAKKAARKNRKKAIAAEK